MSKPPLNVAWISDFPVEWLPDLPEPLRILPRQHPATWQITLLSELEKIDDLRLHVVTLRKEVAGNFSFERGGVTFHVLKTFPMMRMGTLFWLDTFLIRRLFRRIKPDVVHAWGSEKGAAWVAPRLGYPYIATVQGLLIWYREVVRLTRAEYLLSMLEHKSLLRTPMVTAESTFAVQFLRTHFPQKEVFHVEHVPNWAFHKVRRQPGTTPVHFMSNGTLGYRKGTDLLFKALDQLTPQFPFRLTMICGPNPRYEESLRASVSKELWCRVEFKHHLLPSEIAKEMTTPTMMLLPTRVDTGPMAVKEACVAGMPVVASKIGGIPDYIIPGRNGLLFQPDDYDEFVNAIMDACSHPLFSRGLVESKTLEQKRAQLSPDRMAKQFVQAYKSALAVGEQ